MKKSIFILLSLVFLGMAVFGAFGAAHGMEHGGGCFAATAAGMPCMADLAESLDMHFNTLRSFSTAVFTGSLAIAFLVLFVRVAGAHAPRRDFPAVRVSASRLAISDLPCARAFSRWLSRFEHSPSLA